MTELRAVGLHRWFDSADGPIRAVDGVDLEVAAGEFLSVMGPSGCGKSTLLHLLGGLDRPTRGEVHLHGTRVDFLSETQWARLRRRTVGFVFQAFNLVNDLTVIDNLILAGVLAGTSARESRRRASELLERLGLSEKGNEAPARLSGGTAAAGGAGPGGDEPTAPAVRRRANRQPRQPRPGRSWPSCGRSMRRAPRSCSSPTTPASPPRRTGS